MFRIIQARFCSDYQSWDRISIHRETSRRNSKQYDITYPAASANTLKDLLI